MFISPIGLIYNKKKNGNLTAYNMGPLNDISLISSHADRFCFVCSGFEISDLCLHAPQYMVTALKILQLKRLTVKCP